MKDRSNPYRTVLLLVLLTLLIGISTIANATPVLCGVYSTVAAPHRDTVLENLNLTLKSGPEAMKANVSEYAARLSDHLSQSKSGVSSAPTNRTVSDHNHLTLAALFLREPQKGLARFNPLADSPPFVLPAQAAAQHLIINEHTDMLDLAISLGKAAGITSRKYYDEYAPLATSRLVFEAYLAGFRSGITDYRFFDFAAEVKTENQLTAIKIMLEHTWFDTRALEVALKLKSDLQIEILKRMAEAHISHIDIVTQVLPLIETEKEADELARLIRMREPIVGRYLHVIYRGAEVPE